MPTDKPVASDEDDVSATHPQYDERVVEWAKMRDTARGPTAIERGGETYLPMPDGFREQTDAGVALYAGYRMRAQFPDILSPTVIGMVGTVCRIDAVVELPPELEYLRENVDNKKTTMTNFFRKLVEESVTVGGRVLLVDAPDTAEGGDPYVAAYPTEALINWSEERDFFVLNETRLVRKTFQWVLEPRWRVLRLDENGQYTVEVYDEDKRPVQREAPADAGLDYAPVDVGPIPVTIRGGRPMTTIPIVRVGCRDLDLEPDNPPLLGVANAALTIYRLDADYKHQLFMSGQETLFGVGMDEQSRPTCVGPGIAFFAQNPEAKLEYVSPTCSGIEAHERAIKNEKDTAAALGARIIDVAPKSGVESGDALRIRKGGSVATLITIAQTAGEGLEQTLRNLALMCGADPMKVTVKPNLDFIDATLDPKSAFALVQMWQGGAISRETMWANLQRGEIAPYERSAADEKELIDQEQPADPSGAPIGGKAQLKPDFGEQRGGSVPTAGGGSLPTDDSDEPDVSNDELKSFFDPSLLS